MNSRRRRWLVAAALALGTSAAFAQAPAKSPFDRLRTLVGEWTASGPDGAVRTVYRLASAGSVLVETIAPGTKDEMITLYHMDNGKLMLTHYCAAGNQPRMRLDEAASSPGVLAFTFLDGTNLAGPDAGHMHRVKLTFVDDDHVDAEWTWKAGSQEKPEVFHYARVR